MQLPKILTWNDRFALIDRFQPSDDSITQIFKVSRVELNAARSLRRNGTLVPAKNLDYDSYAPAFSINHNIRKPMTEKNTVTTIKLPETATKVQGKRGRKGNNICTAFSNVPNDPTNAVQFASDHKVSIAVLRQSKRFDPFGDKGTIRVKKNKDTGDLMIWREQ